MAQTPLQGDYGMVYIYDTTAEAYKPVACLTSNSLNTTREVRERQTKCAPGVTEKSVGTMNYSISLDGEYIDTTTVGGDTASKSHDALLALQMGGEYVDWKIDTNYQDPNSVKYYGNALITDLTADFPANEDATFTATLDGNGAILLEDPYGA